MTVAALFVMKKATRKLNVLKEEVVEVEEDTEVEEDPDLVDQKAHP